MRPNRHWLLALCGALLVPTACGSTDVEDLQGTWAGKISCFGDTSELRLAMEVEQDRIRGSAQTRTKGSDANYDLTGSQATVLRIPECASTPTCVVEKDCAAVLDQSGKPGNSHCLQGLCLPCFETRQQRQVLLTLRHNNPGLPLPQLELWRYANNLMEGTIKSFCPDESRQVPQVSVTKQ